MKINWKEWDEKLNEVGWKLPELALASLAVTDHYWRMCLLYFLLFFVFAKNEKFRHQMFDRRHQLLSKRMSMTLEEHSELSALEEGRDQRNLRTFILGYLFYWAIFWYSCYSFYHPS
jgi:hypothetical protein